MSSDRAVAMLAGIVLFIVGVLWAAAAWPHEPYSDWLSPKTGFSCCHDRDCRPVRAWRGDDGLWRARIPGGVLVVPPDIILNRVAPDGGSHICISPTGEPLCFVGGVPKS